jgi:two-component system, LytTR family, response regulator
MAINKLIDKSSKGTDQSSSKNDFTEAQMLNKKIALSDKYELIFIKLSDIYYCKAEGFYTKFFLKNRKDIMVSKNIKEYEYILPPMCFFRTHKSYIINLHEINKFIKSDGGYLIMENGDNIPIAIRRKDDFLKTVMNFSNQ